MALDPSVKAYLKRIGSSGGKKRMRGMSKSQRSAFGRAAVRKRWKSNGNGSA